MTKNIIITLLIVLLILSTAFGFYQKKETDKFEAQATENQKIARDATIYGENQMRLANVHVIEQAKALERLQDALAELQICKKRK
jgi:Tfp pilus assembly protein PilO